MKDKTYFDTYEKAKAEIVELTNRRAEIDRRIARLKQVLTGLEPLVHDGVSDMIHSMSPPDSLKEACLQVLKAASEELTPSEVVYKLREMGFEIDGYVNPVAVVTTTLKRLVPNQAKEVEKNRKKAYIYFDPILEEVSATLDKKFPAQPNDTQSKRRSKKEK